MIFLSNLKIFLPYSFFYSALSVKKRVS